MARPGVGLVLALCVLSVLSGPAAAQWSPDPADCEQYQLRVDASQGGTEYPSDRTADYGDLSAAERDLFDRALADDGAVVVRGEAVETLLGMPRVVVHEGTTYRTARTGSRCGLPWAPGLGTVRTVGVLVLVAVALLAGRRILD